MVATTTEMWMLTLHSSKVLAIKELRVKHRTRCRIACIISICNNSWTSWTRGGRTQLIATYNNWTSSIQVTWRICNRSNQIRWYSKIFKTYRITWTTTLIKTSKMMLYKDKPAKIMFNQLRLLRILRITALYKILWSKCIVRQRACWTKMELEAQ